MEVSYSGEKIVVKGGKNFHYASFCFSSYRIFLASFGE